MLDEKLLDRLISSMAELAGALLMVFGGGCVVLQVVFREAAFAWQTVLIGLLALGVGWALVLWGRDRSRES